VTDVAKAIVKVVEMPFGNLAIDGRGSHGISQSGQAPEIHHDLSFASVSDASRWVISFAGSSRAKWPDWPDHIGVKSVAPFVSDLTRNGAEKPPASGKSGTNSDIGPISRTMRVAIARAGRPLIHSLALFGSRCFLALGGTGD
jgi:hypothetical protein